MKGPPAKVGNKNIFLLTKFKSSGKYSTIEPQRANYGGGSVNSLVKSSLASSSKYGQ